MQFRTTTETIVPENEGPKTPIYYATEIDGQPGVFICESYGPGRYSDDQLKQWAANICARLVLVRWTED